MHTTVPGRPNWVTGPLYNALMDLFPEHRTKLEVLDVQRLKTELGMSHEAIYKWLRSSKLTPSNAKALIELSTSESNLLALEKLGREPMKLEDFAKFVFA